MPSWREPVAVFIHIVKVAAFSFQSGTRCFLRWSEAEGSGMSHAALGDSMSKGVLSRIIGASYF
jgi:hypothetical protein